MNKLPLIELVNRWIDIYTYFHFPEGVREEAHYIAYLNQDKPGYPHVLAITAIYLAATKRDISLDKNLIEKITIAHKAHKSRHPGIKWENITKRIQTWKSVKQ